MSRLMITGFSGFVSSHFMEYLYQHHPDFEVYGVSLGTPVFDWCHYRDRMKVEFFEADLMDGDRLSSLFGEIRPDYVLHLAAFSSVAYSWQHPEKSFRNNCNIFLNLLNAARKTTPDCRILSVGSSEEYGAVPPGSLPIREDQPLRPVSPYAVARVAQEQLSKVYADAFGMQVIMTRSFNHIGPGQDSRFVVPSLLSRIIGIRKSGKPEGEIETGDLSVIRDFTDVRDVADAYYRLLTGGTPGEVYNVCSGKGRKLSEIVDLIAEEVGVRVSTKTSPALIRPNENQEVVGSPEKIQKELGWQRKIPFNQTIKDMIKAMISF